MPLPDEDLRNDFKQNVVVHEPHRTFYESFYVYYNGDTDITPVPLYSQLIDIDPSLEVEKVIIQRAIREIDKNPVGSRLIQTISHYLSTYNRTLVKELKQKNKIDSDDEEKSASVLKCYNKIFLRKGNKTLFGCPKAIPQSKDYWAGNLQDYKIHFQLMIDLKDCDNPDISILREGETETTIHHPTLFPRILFHEFVHILDFLYDSRSYRSNNLNFQWKPTLNALWPSLSERHDGLKLAESWDGRITEVKAVIGEEFDPDLDKTHIGRFSELSFAMAAEEKDIRLPYAMCEMALHKDTSSILFESGKKQVSILK